DVHLIKAREGRGLFANTSPWSWSSLLVCSERLILSYGITARGLCVCCFLCLGYPYLHSYAWRYLLAFQNSA
ncbi:hypothetical protein LEMLEM_LOCUS6891, partial [Lemmus lemmus]